MEKKTIQKLSLKKVTLVELDNDRLSKVKGGIGAGEEEGFLSIGHECSAENSCKRVSSHETCYCCPSSRNWCQD